MICQFTITGAPRTKKTSNEVVPVGGRTKVLPSRAYRAWHRDTMAQAFAIKAELRQQGAVLPIVGPVGIAALFYLENGTRGDLTSYMQALADWLQDAGIIADDQQIESWDGTRRLMDRALPRIEVRMEA